MSLLVIVTMDASSVQSGSKCGGSDFSIERILSDRKDSREDEAPEWLCCTRYRPPRLPRSAGACRSRRAGRHARVPFSAAQAAALEAAYTRAPYLAPPALKALAAALQLRDDRIKIWFQNRRARERREKSATIAPPQGVALPPTSGFPPNAWIPQPNFVVPHSTQVFFTHKISDTFRSRESSNTSDNSDSSYAQSHKVIDDHNTILKEEFSDDRPDTPLDVETV